MGITVIGLYGTTLKCSHCTEPLQSQSLWLESALLKPVHTERLRRRHPNIDGRHLWFFDGHCDGQNGLHTYFESMECLWWSRLVWTNLYNRAKAKAIFFFDLLVLTHHCSINTQIGNNATGWKRHHFRSNINVPLHSSTLIPISIVIELYGTTLKCSHCTESLTLIDIHWNLLEVGCCV